MQSIFDIKGEFDLLNRVELINGVLRSCQADTVSSGAMWETGMPEENHQPTASEQTNVLILESAKVEFDLSQRNEV